MPWRLALVGDVMLQHAVQPSAVLEILRSASLAFGNLEVPLSVQGYPADKPIVFRGSPDLAPELRRMGLRIVSFANNHSLDYGPLAMLDTLSTAGRAGLIVIGAGSNLSEAVSPGLTVVDGVCIAWQAFACTLPTGFAATSTRPGIAPIRVRTSFLGSGNLSEEQPGTPPYVFTEVVAADLEAAQLAIQTARMRSDAVVVSVHWGVPPGWSAPFQGPLADYQQPLAHALVNAGASLVVGHHPHTLHGVEIYKGCPVIYSLGNFLFHSLSSEMQPLQCSTAPFRTDRLRPPELRESAVFLLDFDGVNCKRFEIVPCALDAAGESQLAGPQQAAMILRRVREHCERLGTHLDIQEDRGLIRELK